MKTNFNQTKKTSQPLAPQKDQHKFPLALKKFLSKKFFKNTFKTIHNNI
jgi:hypothetical protein